VCQALTSLRMVGAGLLGIVANGVRPPGGYNYYYYYYYYPYPRGSRGDRKRRSSAD
jgi:Mrp family chromosome partitioning ATPase